jgi:hypothetical protein
MRNLGILLAVIGLSIFVGASFNGESIKVSPSGAGIFLFLVGVIALLIGMVNEYYTMLSSPIIHRVLMPPIKGRRWITTVHVNDRNMLLEAPPEGERVLLPASKSDIKNPQLFRAPAYSYEPNTDTVVMLGAVYTFVEPAPGM